MGKILFATQDLVCLKQCISFCESVLHAHFAFNISGKIEMLSIIIMSCAEKWKAGYRNLDVTK